MPVRLKQLTAYLDGLLDIQRVTSDASNNGLQAEGTPEVNKAVFGVDASAALFAAAADCDADFIFTHHGISWGGNLKYLTGMTADRIKLLFANNMSLYAAHLPLDAHPIHGHNAILADMAGLLNRRMFCRYAGHEIGIAGELPAATTAAALAETIAARLNSNYTVFGDDTAIVRKPGIVSGGGGSDAVIAVLEAELDCLITGEITHSHYHAVQESNLPLIALGHYKSETPGVLRVMELIRKEFGIDCAFIDQPTGL